MGALLVCRADQQAALGRAEAALSRQDMGVAEALKVPGWSLRHHGYRKGGPETLLVRGDDFVAVAGTLAFDGKLGRAALAALLDGLDPLAPDWQRLSGEFVLAMRRGGRTFLLGDFFGTFQLFHDTGDTRFVTSLIAAAESMETLSLDAQGVYEFAFNVLPIGDDTVFSELRTLGPEWVVELVADGVRRHPLAKPLPDSADGRPLEARLSAMVEMLRRTTAPQVEAFGDRIFCPLSGGLDSRLLLAMLRSAGVRPHVYVYGPKGGSDVMIATGIAAAEGFPIDHIDKSLGAIEPDAFAEQVTRNFHAMDALPPFGNIFDDGANLRACEARHAGRALAASGGCGEVFRNFFFLPGRALSARAVASTFFARFDTRDATNRFEPRTFLERIAAKLGHAVGETDTRRPIPRGRIEQLYPRVRCRALFGREISLEARYGAYFMPFLDQRVAAEAMTLPLGLKNVGRFEAQLIHAIDPALARHPSAYGHDFAGPPGRRHRFDEWSTRIRPAWVRRASYTVQRRLRPMSDEHGGLLAPEYLGRVIDLEFPAMRRFFHVERIGDSGLRRRLAALEYLVQALGSRVRD